MRVVEVKIMKEKRNNANKFWNDFKKTGSFNFKETALSRQDMVNHYNKLFDRFSSELRYTSI